MRLWRNIARRSSKDAKVTDEQVDELMKELAINGDGNVDYQEFRAAMQGCLKDILTS